MNFIAYIILITLIIDFILRFTADSLNLKNLKNQLPEEFLDIYDQEKYIRSQEYTRVNTRFGFKISIINLIIMLVFWFSGGFNYLDNYIRGLNFHPLINGLLYIGILSLLRALLSIPFSFYRTFSIEERFGFNKTSKKTFIIDLVKGFVLSLVLGIPLLVCILAFFQFTGATAWLWCWIVSVIFILIIQYVTPIWIMPLFNKFKPLEQGELEQAILAYAQSVTFPLRGVFIIDGSKRSTKANAFFTGFGKNKRIALFDTLIANHSVGELVAVLAHEIGHYKKKHLVKRMVFGILHMGIIFYLLSYFVSNPNLFAAFYMENQSIYAGMIFFGMLYAPIELILSLVLHHVSRQHEFEADAFAVQTTGKGNDFINALKKLSASNLSNLTPHPFHVFLNYSHPPVLQRINTIREINQRENDRSTKI